MKANRFFFTFLLLSTCLGVFSQEADKKSSSPETSKWYETLALKGYAQLRYDTFDSDEDCEDCNITSIKEKGLYFKRVRVALYGQITKRIYIYLQPDFTSTTGSSSNFLQLRDAYVDLGLDDDNVFKFRIGQSKVPYGFENVQSSSKRLSIDRSDALNSAFSNERDLGVFFYWTPKQAKQRFSDLTKNGLKGSGDYGVFAIGIFNGQGANNPELNNQQHVVARITYPFLIGKQFIEPSLQAFAGKYVIADNKLSTGVKTNSDKNYTDERIAAGLVIHPQPWGLQAEYNIGKGPQFDKETDSIEVRPLNGGYVMLNYKTKIKDDYLFPYIKAQYYDGGKNHETDARKYVIKELETGIEWQANKHLELSGSYTFTNKRYEDYSVQANHIHGKLIRIQAQIMF